MVIGIHRLGNREHASPHSCETAERHFVGCVALRWHDVSLSHTLVLEGEISQHSAFRVKDQNICLVTG